MNTRRGLVALALVALLCATAGCATKGRFSLVDLDLRDKGQIEASRFESAVPYVQDSLSSTNAVMVSTQAIPLSVWTQLMDVLKIIKCRLRVVSFEWDERGGGQ